MEIVYQNINESTYTFEVENLIFYFSSSFNLRRFKERCISYSVNEERKLINRFHVNIDMKKYFLISFYKLIEKRGFKILYNNKEIQDDFNIISTIEM